MTKESSMLDLSELSTDESIPLDSSSFEETPAPKKRGRKPKAAPDTAAASRPAKAPKPAKATPPPTPDVASLLGRHSENYQKQVGSFYTPNFGKDSRAAASLLKTYGLAKCLELNDAFFRSDDPVTRALGHGFETFKGVVNMLVVQAPVGQAAQMIDPGELS